MIGGGGAITGIHSSIELAESHPINLDADSEPAEGWNVGFNNESGHTLAIGVWAICTPSALEYALGTPTSENNTNSLWAGTCQARSRSRSPRSVSRWCRP